MQYKYTVISFSFSKKIKYRSNLKKVLLFQYLVVTLVSTFDLADLRNSRTTELKIM